MQEAELLEASRRSELPPLQSVMELTGAIRMPQRGELPVTSQPTTAGARPVHLSLEKPRVFLWSYSKPTSAGARPGHSPLNKYGCACGHFPAHHSWCTPRSLTSGKTWIIPWHIPATGRTMADGPGACHWQAVPQPHALNPKP